jgi:glycosyltransferase involved in cell wall biosynthesis
MMRLTRDVLTFFDGHILYGQERPHHHTFVSSSIREEDICVRESQPQPTPPFRLLYVGRLSAEKGVRHLVEATALLAAEGDEVELHIVGMGAMEEELRRTARALGITDQVMFHGFVPHGDRLRQAYRESDVFVLPSLQDQQPKVLLEAMSQSVPVVATRVGGIPAAIRDRKDGLLVPPAQPRAMATAIQRVLSADDLRRQLVRSGLARARAHTVEEETARMMQIVAQHFNGRTQHGHR